MAHKRIPADATPARRATIKDVAKMAGVDPSLVSRIVNGDPRAASTPATRQRVLDAVQVLGYRASVAARGLRLARSMTVGLLLPDLSNPMYASIVRGVEVAAQEIDYGVVLGSRVDTHTKLQITRLLQDGRVDGLLVASGLLQDDALRNATEAGLGPIVLVNRNVAGAKASVIVDDRSGSELAVEHLAALGPTSITGLFGPKDMDTTVRRKKGFRRACAAASIVGREVDAGSWDSRAGYTMGLRLFQSRPLEQTAIFASTFAIGLGVLRAARECGVDIPREVSLITLHDSELAEYTSPPLTAVALPSEEMGATAMTLLHEMLTGGKPRKIVVRTPPALVLRGSTSRPPTT